MNEYFTDEELQMLLLVVNKKLRQEARRPARILANGSDIQALKVRTLAEVRDKLKGLKDETNKSGSR